VRPDFWSLRWDVDHELYPSRSRLDNEHLEAFYERLHPVCDQVANLLNVHQPTRQISHVVDDLAVCIVTRSSRD
jgi:hypothetical protein